MQPTTVRRTIFAACAAAATVSVPMNAADGPASSTASPFSVGSAFDYFYPTVQTHFGGPAGGSSTVSENLSGSLYGGTLYFQYHKLRLEGTFRDGTLRGSGTEWGRAWDERIKRQELELQGSIMVNEYFFFGAGYQYVPQDYTMTTAWSATEKYSDYFHNIYGLVGVQRPFHLYRPESGLLQGIDLTPRLSGALGYGYYSTESRSFANPEQSQLTYRAQPTLQLVFQFRSGWDAFLEGGYKYTGFSSAERTQGGTYYGPCARVGVRYSF